MHFNKKLTKKQKKQLRGRNAMVDKSLREGEQHIVGDVFYKGTNPTFNIISNVIVKTSKGIPFVKAGLA